MIDARDQHASPSLPPADAVGRAYSQDADPPFTRLVSDLRPDSDSALADLIEADARTRLDRSLPVVLERYLCVIESPARMRIALDAAVEFALRSASRAGISEEQAVADLLRAHPELADAIHTAVGLGEGLCSTTAIRGLIRTGSALHVPCDFGPSLPDGRRRFDVRERLGAGTQGEVYLAADRLLAEPDRPAWVAIKRLHAVEIDDHTRSTLVEESRKVRRINHPSVVRVLDRGVDDLGSDYVVYEHVDGGSLSALLARPDRWPAPRDAVVLMVKVCRGVQAAHAAGVAHCDLKPSNILLTQSGEPKVADFGVAARFAAQASDRRRSGPVGNFAFIAPEQFRAEDGALSAPADVYALGGILYYLLTRNLPNGDTVELVVARHSTPGSVPTDHAPGVADPDLAAICRRALDPDPRKRHASAESLALDLEDWLARRPVEWTRPGPVRRLTLFARRQPVTLAAIIACLLAAVGGTAAVVRTRMAAQQRLMQAQLASLSALVQEQEKGTQAVREAMQSAFAVMKVRGGGKISEEWLPQLTIMESLMGPVLFNPAGAAQIDIWSDRLPIVRQIIDAQRKAGREGAIETLFWEDGFAFWALYAGNPQAAAQALAEADPFWNKRLDPADPWRTMRAGMHACVVVQLAEADKLAGRPIDTPALLAAGEQLTRAFDALEADGRRDSMRRLIRTHRERLDTLRALPAQGAGG